MIPIRDINPTRRFAVVTAALIAVNIAVFVFQLVLGSEGGDRFVAAFALVPKRLFLHSADFEGTISPGVTLFTSMFLHGGILHLGGNMLYLWIFGNNIEDSMGRIRFLLFYFLSGAAAGYGHAFLNAASTVPMIGASGAISGVLGAYLVLFPRAQVLTLVLLGLYVRTVEIPAMFVLGFWFLLQFVNALLSSGAGTGVAWFAHVGGFIAGILLIGFFKRRDVPFWGRRRDYYL